MRSAIPQLATAVVCSLGLLLGGCPDSGDALSPPAGFRAGRYGVFTQVVLEWSPVPRADGYELEGRVAGGTWESLLDPGALVPADVVGGTLEFPDDLPELLALEFRIRAARGANRSAWSVARLDTGIRWPEAPSARATPIADGFGRFTGPVTVTWENRSAIASRVEVERAPAGPDPDALPWEPLGAGSLVRGANTFVDATVSDGVSYRYRIRQGADAAWSAPAYADSTFIDVVAPTGLAAAPAAGGVRVSWQHRGTRGLILDRGAPGGLEGAPPIPALPGGSGSYLDPLPAFWPGLRYRLSSTGPEPWYARVWSDPVVLATVELREPVTLRGEYVSLNETGSIAATPEGLLHVAPDGFGGMPRRALRDTGAGWDAEVLPSFSAFVWPGVRVDGAGHPHWVHLRNDAPGVYALVHVWWDGAWRREELAPAVSETGASFDVSPAGTLHVVYETRWAPPEVPTWDVVYRAGTPGAYAEVVLATNTGESSARAGRVEVAADGTGYVLLSRWQVATRLALRAPTGALSQEVVPFADVTSTAMLLGAANGGEAVVTQRRYLWDLGRSGRFLMRRTGGVWQAEEEIEDFDESYLHVAGLSPDGARLAIALTVLYPHHLELRVGTGTGWASGTVGPSAPWSVSGGFWPDGRLHLEVVHAVGGGTTDGARYAEPAAP